MIEGQAVCVHSLAQAVAALRAARAAGRAVTLISAPGAAAYAGCGWWRALMVAAAADAGAPAGDFLDCGDHAGYAFAALRVGQAGLIVAPQTPALEAVRSAARGCGAVLLASRPACLDLAEPGASRRLALWLGGGAG